MGRGFGDVVWRAWEGIGEGEMCGSLAIKERGGLSIPGFEMVIGWCFSRRGVVERWQIIGRAV